MDGGRERDVGFARSIPEQYDDAIGERFGPTDIDGKIRAYVIIAEKP